MSVDKSVVAQPLQVLAVFEEFVSTPYRASLSPVSATLSQQPAITNTNSYNRWRLSNSKQIAKVVIVITSCVFWMSLL